MKKTRNFKSFFVLLLCFVLITAIALFTVGCKANNTDEKSSSSPTSSESSEPTASGNAIAQILGEGENSVLLSVTHKDGEIKHFAIATNKTTVGEALLEVGLIEGEEGQFGLYVKTVDGETLDFNKDGLYWAFYEDGKYAAKGVDQTDIKSGVTYALKAEK